ncbi:hypothetical protein FRB93_013199 [Tulasnella sp. JGI-2019a]|nr:hypothetical protein FRB93_013199 [Tulasnella sp. JGI-2019a]
MALLPIAAVQKAMGRIAPLNLAAAWDNVGLLLESPIVNPAARRILLTIDLTPAVLAEALAIKPGQTPTAVIVSYHPPIFSALKSLTLLNPLQRSLLTCAANGISVYSPHTSLDITKGGINDWLTEAVWDTQSSTGNRVAYDDIGKIKITDDGQQFGEGKLMTFEKPIQGGLDRFAAMLKNSLDLEHVQLARSPSGPTDIKTVAICAGSGNSVIGRTPADVYLTGEMAHHDVLAATASNTHVILCGHTNTERPYLPKLKKRLEEELKKDQPGATGVLQVAISEADAHPLTIA